MTRAEIGALGGRELDVAIVQAFFAPTSVTWADGEPWAHYDGRNLHEECIVPHYSRDMAEAWTVVEWLRAKGYRVLIDLGEDDVQVDQLCEDEAGDDYWDMAATVPIADGSQAAIASAICRAALLAVLKGNE